MNACANETSSRSLSDNSTLYLINTSIYNSRESRCQCTTTVVTPQQTLWPSTVATTTAATTSKPATSKGPTTNTILTTYLPPTTTNSPARGRAADLSISGFVVLTDSQNCAQNLSFSSGSSSSYYCSPTGPEDVNLTLASDNLAINYVTQRSSAVGIFLLQLQFNGQYYR